MFAPIRPAAADLRARPSGRRAAAGRPRFDPSRRSSVSRVLKIRSVPGKLAKAVLYFAAVKIPPGAGHRGARWTGTMKKNGARAHGAALCSQRTRSAHIAAPHVHRHTHSKFVHYMHLSIYIQLKRVTKIRNW